MKRPAELETPVALFVFNRPKTTARVFARTAEARPARLYVVADGARSHEEAALCSATRAIVQRIDWDCELSTNFADRNLGCGKRVSSGLDWVFENCEEAIILEDDCLPDPTIFGYYRVYFAKAPGSTLPEA